MDNPQLLLGSALQEVPRIQARNYKHATNMLVFELYLYHEVINASIMTKSAGITEYSSAVYIGISMVYK